LIPTELAGAPLPFKIVLGIEDALLPAALAGVNVRVEEKSAIEIRMANRVRFTGDLLVVGV
jgi:hypothetical protein